MIRDGGGKAMLKTVEGEDSPSSVAAGNLMIDAKGDKAKMTIP